jgi:pimeloyl-ACP methyl ester carboxylesterase
LTFALIPGPAGTLSIDHVEPQTPSEALPVVLVHSLAGNASQWSAQLTHLQSTRRAVALELRGHGRSDPAKNGDYTLEGMANDIAGVVERLNLERIVLVGHSLGGGVALVYAGAHPERVAGLLLIDPIGDGKQISPTQAQPLLDALATDYATTIQEYWKGIAGSDAVVRQRLLADLEATPQDVVVSAFGEVLRFNPDPWLCAYHGPILSVVTLYNDQPFSLHRLGKGFPHRVVSDTGHWIQLDAPDELNQIIDEFLEKSAAHPRLP